MIGFFPKLLFIVNDYYYCDYAEVRPNPLLMRTFFSSLARYRIKPCSQRIFCLDLLIFWI